MKRIMNRLLSVIIALAILIGLLQNAALAVGTSAKDMASAYKQVLLSVSSNIYGMKKTLLFL